MQVKGQSSDIIYHPVSHPASGEGSLHPGGTYGHKEECPCYNNWKTKEDGPKCP
ncbi:hypothetical protein FNV43_RR02348 [Rhamnella rubrinervis]|uniref:Uncharacterized protein n=1 Tax=Rhamnella rubrinervis TaxID=2594499 RepID=A0A8K0HS40_9ROSA|nr:hypothetical protein FNV43_RR02348 [Rhamnella rubrinervis]